jgi:hypothetical protein
MYLKQKQKFLVNSKHDIQVPNGLLADYFLLLHLPYFGYAITFFSLADVFCANISNLVIVMEVQRLAFDLLFVQPLASIWGEYLLQRGIHSHSNHKL